MRRLGVYLGGLVLSLGLVAGCDDGPEVVQDVLDEQAGETRDVATVDVDIDGADDVVDPHSVQLSLSVFAIDDPGKCTLSGTTVRVGDDVFELDTFRRFSVPARPGDAITLLIEGEGACVLGLDEPRAIVRKVAVFAARPDIKARIGVRYEAEPRSLSRSGQVGGAGRLKAKIDENVLVDPRGERVSHSKVQVSLTHFEMRDPEQVAGQSGDGRGPSGELFDSQGVVEIVARSETGEELQIVDGESITVQLPAPEDPPAQARLWRFDDDTGVWTDGGVAVLDEATNTYTANLDHLSLWSIQNAAETTCVTGQLLDHLTNEPLIGLQVRLLGVDFNGFSTTLTDDEGRFVAYAKTNSTVLIELAGELRPELRLAPVATGSTLAPEVPSPGDPACTNLEPERIFWGDIRMAASGDLELFRSSVAPSFRLEQTPVDISEVGAIKNLQGFISLGLAATPERVMFPELPVFGSLESASGVYIDGNQMDPDNPDAPPVTAAPDMSLVFPALSALGGIELVHLSGLSDMSFLPSLQYLGALDLRLLPELTTLQSLSGVVGIERLRLADVDALNTITPLSHIEFLRDFTVSQHNERFVSDLTSLAVVDGLGINNVTSDVVLPFFDGLSVTGRLRVENSALSSLAGLDLLGAERIEIRDCPKLSDLGTQDLSSLKVLLLERNPGLTSVSDVTLPPRVESLALIDNGLGSLTFGGSLTELGDLALREPNASDISGLASLEIVDRSAWIEAPGLTSLKDLSNLSRVGPEALTPDAWATMTLPERFDFRNFQDNNSGLAIVDTNITSLEGLGNIATLSRLYLINNRQLADLSGINATPSLYRLSPVLLVGLSDALDDLSGLEASPFRDITIASNAALTDVSALSAVIASRRPLEPVEEGLSRCALPPEDPRAMPGACGQECATSDDCSGDVCPTCATAADGVPRCGACVEEGMPCAESAECCGYCIQGMCSERAQEPGDPCQSDDECFIGTCTAAGTCEESCNWHNVPCSVGSECCSGSCVPPNPDPALRLRLNFLPLVSDCVADALHAEAQSAGLAAMIESEWLGYELADIERCSIDSFLPTQGNGLLEDGEMCDVFSVGGGAGFLHLDFARGLMRFTETCESLGYSGGVLVCDGNAIETHLCKGGEVCGDGLIGPREACDGEVFPPGIGCESFGFSAGTVSCSEDCLFIDRSDCRDLVCGDDILDRRVCPPGSPPGQLCGELCDGSQLGGFTCEDFGFPEGEVTCQSCIPNGEACSGEPLCGDDIAQRSAAFRYYHEECDGADLGGITDCRELGYESGTVGCRPPELPSGCTWDTQGCEGSLCGDGTRQELEHYRELCEGDDLNGKTCADVLPGSSGTLGCTEQCLFDATACRLPSCGNAVLEPAEECDGGLLRDDLSALMCEQRWWEFGASSPDEMRGSFGGCLDTCHYDFSGCFVCRAEGESCSGDSDCCDGTCDADLGVCSTACQGDSCPCAEGFANCDADPDCETSIAGDPFNCGGCGVECASGFCVDSTCL